MKLDVAVRSDHRADEGSLQEGDGAAEMAHENLALARPVVDERPLVGEAVLHVDEDGAFEVVDANLSDGFRVERLEKVRPSTEKHATAVNVEILIGAGVEEEVRALFHDVEMNR